MGTITKALELLDHFTKARSEIGLGDFVRLTGRDKATVHRHLTELEQNGFLEQDAISRAYRLGPALLRLTAVREAAFPVRRLLRPIVTELAEDIGELAHASLLQGDMLSSVFHFDPLRHGTQVSFDAAEMLPLHATSSGLAVLAFSGAEMTDRVLGQTLPAMTDKTITDPDVLRDLLEEVRGTGISQLDSAFDTEVTSQGAPLFGLHGRVIGALSVAVPRVRATPRMMAHITPRLRAAAHAATQSLGGRYPDFIATNGPARVPSRAEQ
ncbi:HTH-type transcriptional regulator KipR [Sulfitobacter sp. THAF37]|uniref:IclR family transcriptional regulator n=1 Tax=Sulfitobacter sp. THAF37 TaxID=2587855 RepID=UPI00126826A0|nr:IclR family transcriptional regulator [Sulfitobacter sp. THAF37]QFT59578.1 HTH-type transcriptional regulator KipR [Sulfitobacter sp. THAF37]